MLLTGKWINQNGSVLHIDVVNNDQQVVGRFESKKGRSAVGTEYPMVGVRNGELLSLLVDFRTADGKVLHTQWILARQFEDSDQTNPTQPWNTFLTNADVFHFVS
jgi:hypothetical protein